MIGRIEWTWTVLTSHSNYLANEKWWKQIVSWQQKRNDHHRMGSIALQFEYRYSIVLDSIESDASRQWNFQFCYWYVLVSERNECAVGEDAMVK